MLAGDIEKDVEADIIETYPEFAEVDLLLVPHHGSKTSSSPNFVAQLSPEIALVSAGYGNSFGHPAIEVSERYERIGAEIYSTAESGALRFEWQEIEGDMKVSTNRQSFLYWWQE